MVHGTYWNGTSVVVAIAVIKGMYGSENVRDRNEEDMFEQVELHQS